MYFGQIIVKSTQFGQNWVLLIRKWYTDEWEIRQKLVLRKSDFRGPACTSMYDFGESNPPGGMQALKDAKDTLTNNDNIDVFTGELFYSLKNKNN